MIRTSNADSPAADGVVVDPLRTTSAISSAGPIFCTICKPEQLFLAVNLEQPVKLGMLQRGEKKKEEDGANLLGLHLTLLLVFLSIDHCSALPQHSSTPRSTFLAQQALCSASRGCRG